MSEGAGSPTELDHQVVGSPSCAKAGATSGSSARTVDARTEAASPGGSSSSSVAGPALATTVPDGVQVPGPVVRNTRRSPVDSSPTRASSGSHRSVSLEPVQARRPRSARKWMSVPGAVAPGSSACCAASTPGMLTSRRATTPVDLSPRTADTVTRTDETGAPDSRTRANPLSGSIARSTDWSPAVTVTRRTGVPVKPSTAARTSTCSTGRGAGSATSSHWPTGSVSGADRHIVSAEPSTAAAGPSSGRTGPTLSVKPLDEDAVARAPDDEVAVTCSTPSGPA